MRKSILSNIVVNDMGGLETFLEIVDFHKTDVGGETMDTH